MSKQTIIYRLSISLMRETARRIITPIQAIESPASYSFIGESGQPRRLKKVQLREPQNMLQERPGIISVKMYCRKDEIDIAARELEEYADHIYQKIEGAFIGLKKAKQNGIHWVQNPIPADLPSSGELKL